jgi:tetratricopeptide (TPR) repeat protein
MLLLFLAFEGAPTAADTVKLREKPPFRKVQINDMRDGRIVFRGVSGQTLRKPLEQVEWIEIDAIPSLGAAEQARLAAKADEALSAYRRVLETPAFPWLRGYVRFRLVAAAENAGRFDDAITGWLSLANEGNAPPLPRKPGPRGGEANVLAIAKLTQAVSAPGRPEIRQRLQVLLLEVALLEGIEPLPAGLESRLAAQAVWARVPWASDLAERGAGAAGRSSLLLPDDEPAADSIFLLSDTGLLTTGTQLLEINKVDDAVQLLSRSLPFVRSGESRPWRIALGRALIEKGEFDRAIEVLTEQSGSEPGSGPNGESAYYAGLAHQKAGRTAAAREAYGDAVKDTELPAELRLSAQEALTRWEAP